MMSFIKHYEIYRLVRDLHNDTSLRERFRADPLAVLMEYSISEETKQAILDRDYIHLYSTGIHPLVVFNICHIIEKNPDKYRQEIVPKLAKLGLK